MLVSSWVDPPLLEDAIQDSLGKRASFLSTKPEFRTLGRVHWSQRWGDTRCLLHVFCLVSFSVSVLLAWAFFNPLEFFFIFISFKKFLIPLIPRYIEVAKNMVE